MISISESSERCFLRILNISNAFVEQEWPERKDMLLHKYFEQEEGERQVLVVFVGRFLAGYKQQRSISNHGPW